VGMHAAEICSPFPSVLRLPPALFARALRPSTCWPLHACSIPCHACGRRVACVHGCKWGVWPWLQCGLGVWDKVAQPHFPCLLAIGSLTLSAWQSSLARLSPPPPPRPGSLQLCMRKGLGGGAKRVHLFLPPPSNCCSPGRRAPLVRLQAHALPLCG
jgi:hypothetical protein